MIVFKKFFLGTVALVFIGIITIGVMLVAVPRVLSQSKSYHSGDAINYQGRLIIGTADQGKLEIFKLDQGRLSRTAQISLVTAGTSYSDPVFVEEFGELYFYTVDGRNLYKYKISDPANPILINQASEYGLGDWFSGVVKADNRIVTVGTSGLKLWTHELQRIDSYKLAVANPYNLILSPRGSYIFYLEKGLFTLYNAPNRSARASFDSFDKYTISQASVFMNDNHDHKAFNDDMETKLYLVDDRELKQIDFTSYTTKTFRHISSLGYDVAGIPGEDHLYFSDGVGLVKIRKSDFKPLTWVYTTSKFGDNGWAMGLKAVNTGEGQRVVLFNNSSIVVMDENLELVDRYINSEFEREPAVSALSLTLDKNRAAAGSLISLGGTGFGANEPLTITFAGESMTGKADVAGRFVKIITVPQAAKQRTDIKVTGGVSKLTYSISFDIE
jgi:hypothetical protein